MSNAPFNSADAPTLASTQSGAPPASAAPGAQPEDEERISIFSEFVLFLRENKKWWMIPLIVVFGLMALLLGLAVHAGALAPFLYSFL